MRVFPAEIRQGSDDECATELDPTWSIGESFTAGYLELLAVRAGLQQTSRPHPVAIATSFLLAAQAGSAQLEVEQLRRGKSLETSRITMAQGGETVLTTTLTAATLPRRAPDVDMAPQIDLPPPDRCEPLTTDTLRGNKLAILDHVELRLPPECIHVMRGAPDGSFTLRGWLRLTAGSKDPSTVDPALGLLVAADAFPPVTFTVGRYGWAPTVQLTSYLRAIPSPGWLRAEKRGRLLAGGWLDEECTIRDSAGTLVLQFHQLSRVPRR